MFQQNNMKKIILSLTLFYFLTNLYAQTWSPVGAKWTYTFSSWGVPYADYPQTIECIGDTILQGKSCRIFHGNCNCGFTNDTSYLYYENDKIYLYTDSVIGFHVLYDFTASIGDSWSIIAPLELGGDTSIIVVDSIGTKIFSGDTFNIQYIHNLNYNDIWRFDSYIINGIGCSSCFFPQHATCDPWTYPIRCYEDSSGLIKFSSLACDTVIYYDIIESSLNNLIDIYPNPTNNELFIDISDINNSEYSIDIYSSTGQKQISYTGIKNSLTIDIEKLVNGLYFVRLTKRNSICIMKKFIKE